MTVVGRTQQLAAIDQALDDPTCGGCLLTGEAGVGKTHLAAHVAADREARGDDVRRVYPNAAADELPLGGLAAGFSPADAYHGMVAPTVAIIRNLEASERPVLIVIDDVDALDDASAGVLATVADAGLARLLLTVRRGSAIPDAIDHSLSSGAIVSMECSTLDERSTGELARSFAGCELTPATERHVFRTTRGNPLYVRELIAAATEAGTLRVSEQGGILDQIPGDSTRLVDLLERRLGTLDDDERDALRRLAAAGSASHGVLAPFVDDATIARLEQRGLIETVLDGRRLQIRPAHPMHGEILRASETPLSLRQLRTELAARITELGMRRSHDRFRLATWSLDGIGSVEPAVLAEATAMAKAAGDRRLGPRLARAAFTAERSAANARALAHILYNTGDWDALRPVLDEWGALATTDMERAEHEEIVATAWFWRGADDAPLRRLLGEWDVWPAGETRDHLQAAGAALLITNGRIDEAVERAEALDELPPGVSAVRRALTLGHGWRSQGRPLAAAALVTDTLMQYREFGPEVFALSDSVMAGVRIQALADAGEFAEVDRLMAEGADAWRDAGDSSNVALTQLAHGWSWYLRGEFERAAQLAKAAAIGFEVDRQDGMGRWGTILLALALAQSPDTTLADKALAELDAGRDHPARIFDAYAHRARGWSAHQRGYPDEARDHFVAGHETAAEAGNLIAAIGCDHDVLRIGFADSAVELLAQLPADRIEQVEGRFLDAQLRHLRAASTRRFAELDECSQLFERVGAPHLAAECATAAAASPDATTRAATRSLQRATELRAGVTGGIDELVAAASLTPRERDVVRLVTTGLTSREAAERLSISRRTVETHLGNAYTKLGVNDRIGLLERVRLPSPR